MEGEKKEKRRREGTGDMKLSSRSQQGTKSWQSKPLGSLPTPLEVYCQSPCHPELQLEKGIKGAACPLGCSVESLERGR